MALSGDLGSGKTTFVKGLAAAFGLNPETVTSPTFTLMNVYPLKPSYNGADTFVHIDTYRLKNEQELIAIGAEDYLGAPDAISVIEWPEKLTVLLNNKKINHIRFHTPGSGASTERHITIT